MVNISNITFFNLYFYYQYLSPYFDASNKKLFNTTYHIRTFTNYLNHNSIHILVLSQYPISSN